MSYKIFEKTEGVIAGISVFVILEFLTCFIYINAISAQKGEIFEGLYRTTNVIKTLIDKDLHQQLHSKGQEKLPIYSDQIEPLSTALNADSSIEFIYTMVQIDTNVHFILDPTPVDDLDKNGVSIKCHIMDIYDNPSNELKQCFKTHKTTITKSVYYDQWGGHISCFSPIFDKDKFIGVIGVDISTETYNARLQPIKKATQRAMVTIFFIAYLSGIIIWFLRRLQKTSETKIQ